MNEDLKKLPESAVLPWLDLFADPVCERIAAGSQIHLGKDASAGLKESLRMRLFLLSGNVLFRECLRHTEKMNPLAANLPDLVPDETRREGAKKALADLLERGMTAFDEEYPFLRPRMETVSRHFELAVGEMLLRIDRCRLSISEHFFDKVPFSEIRALSFSGADTHNRGRAAAKIVTDRGTFLYKPHDLRQDVFFYRFAEKFFPDTIRAPDSIACHEDGTEYGFCEFVINRPASTKEETKRYYYHLGGFSAITQILGSVDMHFENILADSTRPMPVDLETCFMPRYRSGNTSDEEEEPWKRELASSVAGNGMFPTRIGGVETGVLIMRSPDNVSMPVIDGNAQTVYGYLDDFYSGFADTYRQAMARRSAIRTELMNAPDFSVRIVVRPTNYYMKAAALTTDKVCLNDEEEAERRVRARLVNNPYRLPDELWDRVRECECGAIFRGDIPYFYTKSGSTALYDPEGVCIEGVFRQSSIDEALYRLDHMSEAELKFELQLQRELIERAVRPADGSYVKKDEPWTAVSDEECIAALLNDSITTPSGKPLWFVNQADTRRMFMGSGYYNGLSGMAVVLAAYLKVHPDTACAPEIQKRLQTCLEWTEAYISDAERQTVLRYPEFSGNRKNGCAGHIEGLMQLYEYIPDERYAALAGRAVQLLERYSCENCPDLSYRDGIAGILAVLCRYRSRLGVKDSLIRRYAGLLMSRKTKEAGGMILWHPTRRPREISGLDIGIGGIGLALHMAGTLLRDDSCLQAAEDAFAYERSVYREDAGGFRDMSKSTASPELYGGYHSGNAGLGFLWLYLGDQEMLEKTADAAFCSQPVFSDRLCDGNPGTWDFLLEAGRALCRPELREKARTMIASCGTRVRHYQDAAFEQVYEPSVFSGDAGYLYLRLRTAYPEKARCLLSAELQADT